MNILFFVMTMLMMLAILTYARVESFRSLTALDVQFTKYMEHSERKSLNTREISWYDTLHATTRKTGDSPTQPKPKNQANSRISIYLLLNPQVRQQPPNPAQFNKMLVLTKRLLARLYSGHAFYTEIEQKRSGFLDEILSQVMAAAANLPSEKKITSTADLANLNLGDIELNDVFYKMLKGLPSEDAGQERPDEDVEESQASQDEGESQDLPVAAPPPRSPIGYPKLSDFITVKKSSGFRIYLASREILYLLFPDPHVVESIIATRNSLYQQVMGGMDKDTAKGNFQQQFMDKRDPMLEVADLDFSVSKTNPIYYE